jgi:hypothetical protein
MTSTTNTTKTNTTTNTTKTNTTTNTSTGTNSSSSSNSSSTTTKCSTTLGDYCDGKSCSSDFDCFNNNCDGFSNICCSYNYYGATTYTSSAYLCAGSVCKAGDKCLGAMTATTTACPTSSGFCQLTGLSA